MSQARTFSFLAFSIDSEESRELARLARRLSFRDPRALAVDVFRVGLQSMTDRFEPTTRAARFLRQCDELNAPAARSSRHAGPSTRRAPDDPDRKRRRNRLSSGN
jgi:hypothetical protein